MLQAFKDWANKPYTDDMNVGYWFLFLGMLAVFSWAWAHLLAGHIKVNSSAL